jgi:hypothetical protein
MTDRPLVDNIDEISEFLSMKREEKEVEARKEQQEAEENSKDEILKGHRKQDSTGSAE